VRSALSANDFAKLDFSKGSGERELPVEVRFFTLNRTV
jgi:hypothetical protein